MKHNQSFLGHLRASLSTRTRFVVLVLAISTLALGFLMPETALAAGHGELAVAALNPIAWLKGGALAALQVAILDGIVLFVYARATDTTESEEVWLLGVTVVASVVLCSCLVYLLAFFLGDFFVKPFEQFMNRILSFFGSHGVTDPFSVSVATPGSWSRIPSLLIALALLVVSGAVFAWQILVLEREPHAIAATLVMIPVQYVVFCVMMEYLLVALVWVITIFAAANSGSYETYHSPWADTGPLVDIEPEESSPDMLYSFGSSTPLYNYHISDGDGFMRDSDGNMVHVHKDVDDYWYDDQGNLLS